MKDGRLKIMQQFQFMDIVFLGIIVLLLINRLRSVLGTRPEKDETPRSSSKVVDISEYRTLENSDVRLEQDLSAAGDFEQDAEILQTLSKIKEAHPTFDLADFMRKAPRAFEYIAQAFAKGNKTDLSPMLSRDIYKRFEKAIDDRAARKETAEFSLIGFKSIKLTQANLIGNLVELTVEFETEQTNILKNEQGEVILGDPTYIETVTDVWTFRRDMKSSSPVWVLTATHHKTSAE